MTHRGATFAYSGIQATGFYADGSPWVSGGGNAVSITSISPASALIDRLDDNNNPTGPQQINGAVLNPGSTLGGLPGPKTTLAEKQLRNQGQGNTYFKQGYDAFVVGQQNMPYGAALNLDPGHTGVPIVLTEGSVVKAIGRGVPDAVSRPAVATMIPLTVVASAVPEGSFMPAPATLSKAPMYNVSQLRMDRLPNLSVPGLTGAPTVSEARNRLHFHTWEHAFNANSRNIVPDWPSYVYGGDRWVYMEAMLTLCFDFWTVAEKREIAIKLVQWGLVLAARVEEGGIYHPNGGHDTGYKAFVAFAAHMLNDDPRLIGLLDTKVLATGYSSDGSPAGSSVWAEDKKIAYLTTDLIASSQASAFIPHTAGQLGWPEWFLDGIHTKPQTRNNLLVPGISPTSPPATPVDVKDNYDESKRYRAITAMVMVPSALALRLMGARAIYNHQPFFDYADRFMTWRLEPRVLDSNNDVKAYSRSAWALTRGTDGYWSP